MTKEKISYTRSFYAPHDPADTAYTGELTNPWTGECYIPPSMTKQSFVQECDINNILAEYKLPHQFNQLMALAGAGTFADLPPAEDFQAAMNSVLAAQAAFDAMPSGVRARFHNDPALLLEFLGNPANQDEAIKLGLAVDNRPPAPPSPLAEAPKTSPDANNGG